MKRGQVGDRLDFTVKRGRVGHRLDFKERAVAGTGWILKRGQ